MNDFPDTEPKKYIHIHDKVEPAVLAALLGYNVSLLYADGQKGRLPFPLIEHTYAECVHGYVKYLKKNEEVKLEKARLEHELKVKKQDERTRSFTSGSGTYDDGSMPPIVVAKHKQAIRLDRARENQLWVRTAIERQDYLSIEELEEIVEPFLISIRNSLMAISNESEEVKKQVDLAMDELYSLGLRLIESANVDSSEFVEKVLSTDVDLDEIEVDAPPLRLL